MIEPGCSAPRLTRERDEARAQLAAVTAQRDALRSVSKCVVEYTAQEEAEGRLEPRAVEILAALRDAMAAAEQPQPPAEAARSWPEDAIACPDNGQYSCRCVACGAEFVGHKRRVTCRLCAQRSQPPAGGGA